MSHAWAMRRVALLSLGLPEAVSVLPRRGSPSDPQNPGCWTDGFTFELCCQGDREMGCFSPDPDGLHKRERCCATPCGLEVAAAAEQSGCDRVGAWNVTVVSGLWNLQRQTWSSHIRYSEGGARSYGNYLEWMDALLRKRQALLLFLDPEAAAFARPRRQAYGLARFTCIVEVTKEMLPQMRHREAYERAHAENVRRLPGDSQPEVVHANYTLVVNSKPELLACAALWNPFRSTTFAWVDAGSGRKEGFPQASTRRLVFPQCPHWHLCVGRRMWLFFDFRTKLKRLEHGTTFDSTVLLGGREGVLNYALWFQWAIDRYLAENIMDDEQSVIAEVWWSGGLSFREFYGMTWQETTVQLLQADVAEELLPVMSLYQAREMGRKWGHPDRVRNSFDHVWVPTDKNLGVAFKTPMRTLNDPQLELVAYGLWCIHGRAFDYYARFCDAFISKHKQEEDSFDTEALQVVSKGGELLTRETVIARDQRRWRRKANETQ